MKLRYEFTMMDMGGEIAAVPTGDNAAEFHGVLNLEELNAAVTRLLREGLLIAP